MPEKDTESQSAVEVAIQALKEKDLAAAREHLGIDEAGLPDEGFRKGLIAFDNAVSLFRQNRHLEVRPYLEDAGVIADRTADEKTKEIYFVVNSLVLGLSQMMAGDSEGAAAHFEAMSEYFDEQKFFDPELEQVALYTRSVYHLARANRLLAASMQKEAENEVATVLELQERILKDLDPALDENVGMFCEAQVTRVEIVLALAMLELAALDIDEAGRQLAAAEQAAKDAGTNLMRMPDSPIKCVGRAILDTYEGFRGIQRVARVLLIERSDLTPELYRELQATADRLFEADRHATEAGPRGQKTRTQIDHLRRQVRNLSEMARPRSRGFGRFAGLVTLASLIVLFGAVQLLAKPTGIYGLLYFFGALIVSLIAGFGFQALRFRPLLSLYSDTLKLAKKDGNGKGG